jgi:hypothetical protein
MKRSFVMAWALLTMGRAFSQERPFVIQQGSTLDYIVHVSAGDVPVSAVLTRASEDEVIFSWIMHSGAGIFRVQRASLDSARHGYWDPPVDGEDLKLDDSRCLLQLSKACWKDIQLNRPMAFGSARYMVLKRNVPYRTASNTVDCLYLETEDGHSSLWVANNENLPMILKTEGNPDGINVELVSVR